MQIQDRILSVLRSFILVINTMNSIEDFTDDDDMSLISMKMRGRIDFLSSEHPSDAQLLLNTMILVWNRWKMMKL